MSDSDCTETMQPGPRRPRHDRHQQAALAAFVSRKAEIDAMLARPTALSDDHFNADPDAVHWGHVGTLEHYADLLRQITDSAFGEGEHAQRPC